MKRCSIDGCDAKHYARDLCQKCYFRQRRNPNPPTVVLEPDLVAFLAGRRE